MKRASWSLKRLPDTNKRFDHYCTLSSTRTDPLSWHITCVPLLLPNPFHQDLDGDDVMVLDALNIIYVWVGAGANKEEKKEAEKTAQVCEDQPRLQKINRDLMLVRKNNCRDISTTLKWNVTRRLLSRLSSRFGIDVSAIRNQFLGRRNSYIQEVLPCLGREDVQECKLFTFYRKTIWILSVCSFSSQHEETSLQVIQQSLLFTKLFVSDHAFIMHCVFFVKTMKLAYL